MGYGRKFLLLPTLALLACAANGDSDPVSRQGMSCHLTGEKWAGASEEELCEIFRLALAEEESGVVARVELAANPTDTARAVAFDEAGNVVAGLEVSVMDRHLGPGSWRSLARGLLQAIARRQSPGSI